MTRSFNTGFSSKEKLSLGTVKLGDPHYGFSNRRSFEDSSHFLKKVISLGVRKFDTSPRYGDSEKKLGKFFKYATVDPLVSTKVDALRINDKRSFYKMEQSLKKSLDSLCISSLDTFYLHQNEIEILSDPYINEGLRKLKDKGLFKNCGVSVYNSKECEYALSSDIFDVIQMPINICDLSLYNKYIKNTCSKKEIRARSLLLQGIIANRNDINKRIKQSSDIKKYLNLIDIIASRINVSPLELSLSFTFNLPNINEFIVGTISSENLQRDMECLLKEIPSFVFDELYSLACEKKTWSDPRIW